MVSFLSPEHEGAFSDSFIELSSKKKARVRHSSSRREGEHASISEQSGRSHTFPSPPPPPPSSPYTHTHTPFLVLLLTFSLMSSYTPDEDTGQATEGRRVVRPARGRGRGRSAKTTLATSSSDKCRSDLKPGRGRGGRTSSRVGATSLTIGAVSEHSGRSHTFPSHPPPPPHQPLTHTLFSSCCYSHSHSCPLILQMKTLLKLQRAIELSDQHMVVVVVVVPRPLLQLVPATSAGQV